MIWRKLDISFYKTPILRVKNGKIWKENRLPNLGPPFWENIQLLQGIGHPQNWKRKCLLTLSFRYHIL
jgi:hypothetical protein